MKVHQVQWVSSDLQVLSDHLASLDRKVLRVKKVLLVSLGESETRDRLELLVLLELVDHPASLYVV